jgi:hypothetical protein
MLDKYELHTTYLRAELDMLWWVSWGWKVMFVAGWGMEGGSSKAWEIGESHWLLQW